MKFEIKKCKEKFKMGWTRGRRVRNRNGQSMGRRSIRLESETLEKRWKNFSSCICKVAEKLGLIINGSGFIKVNKWKGGWIDTECEEQRGEVWKSLKRFLLKKWEEEKEARKEERNEYKKSCVKKKRRQKGKEVGKSRNKSGHDKFLENCGEFQTKENKKKIR